MSKRANKSQQELELLAKGERMLNRVLGYQAAIAVHQLKDDLGIEVKELRLSVEPLAADAIGVYRVICTIKSASAMEPIVLESIVEPGKAVATVADRAVA